MCVWVYIYIYICIIHTYNIYTYAFFLFVCSRSSLHQSTISFPLYDWSKMLRKPERRNC